MKDNLAGGKESGKISDLMENKDFMEVMESAEKEDYKAAAEKITEMEKKEFGEEKKEYLEEKETISKTEALYRKYLAERQGVKIKFSLTGEEVAKAIKIFQKKTLYTKNIIYTVLLSIITVLYGIATVKEPDKIINYIISIGCPALIYLIWSMPYKHLKSAAAAADAVDDDFEVYVYSNGLFSGEEGTRRYVPFSAKTFCVEDEESFVLGVNKEVLFLFPKHAMEQEEQSKLSNMLKTALGEKRYETKIKDGQLNG